MTTARVEPFAPEEFFEFIARPDVRTDPFPFYARMRSTEPVYRLPLGFWAISGYEYVAEVMRDARFSSDERKSNLYAPSQFESSPFGKISRAMLLFRDEPDHKRLRDLVQRAFTRRIVEDLRERIGSLVSELLGPILDSGSGELMSEFAYPFPVIVICELLGVPLSDRERFQRWAHDFATRFEIEALRSPETEARADAATLALIEYFEDLIVAKRVEPTGDLLSSLVAVEDAGDKLTHDELLATCLLLLLAGHETTANLIGNGTLALMRNRDQWERLVADPSLVRSAVEELLRYDSPVQMIQRIALEEIELGTQTIETGGILALMLPAANRDPSRFADPDRLDIMRDDAPLVAFGGGIHFCLGAPLARLEAQLAFGALARSAPNLRLAGEAQWRPTFVLRGLETLPVATD